MEIFKKEIQVVPCWTKQNPKTIVSNRKTLLSQGNTCEWLFIILEMLFMYL